MDKITAYMASFVLSIFFVVTTSYFNTANAFSLVKPIATKKVSQKKKIRLAGCHNLSRSRLNSKAKRFHRTIIAAGQKHGVNPNLIKAVITTESCFRPRARGTSGEKGLMQIMYATGKRFNVKDRYSPWQNIHGGAEYLAYLLKRYNGSKRYAVAAYNTGEGRIRKNGYIPNKAYVYKVMAAYHKFNRSKFSKRSLERNIRQNKRRKNQRSSYTVRSGDSISKIAMKHGISTAKLIKVNRLKRPYTIEVGDNIYLGNRSYKRNTRQHNKVRRYYRIRPNDTLKKIATKTGVSIKKIRQLNRLKKGKKLTVGTRLKLTNKGLRQSNKRYYYVRSGDTLYSVMRRTGVSMKQLIHKNHLRKPYVLRVNQKIRLK